MFAGSVIVGLAVGGTIIQSFGWRVTFFSIIPISVILWVIINKFINDAQYQTLGHIDPAKNDDKPSALDVKEYISKSNYVDSNDHSNAPRNRNNNGKTRVVTNKGIKAIDIKGAIALAVTITSFLIVLSYMETTLNDNSNIENDHREEWKSHH